MILDRSTTVMPGEKDVANPGRSQLLTGGVLSAAAFHFVLEHGPLCEFSDTRDSLRL